MRSRSSDGLAGGMRNSSQDSCQIDADSLASLK